MGAIPAAQVAGLLYVGRNITQVAVSFPIDVMSDLIGPRPLLVVGFGLGTLVAVMAAVALYFHLSSLVFLAVLFLLAGLYVAAQEALEPTVTAAMVSDDTLAISDGALGLVNGVVQFVSSAIVGILWTTVSPSFGFGLAAALMLAGTVSLGRLNAKHR